MLAGDRLEQHGNETAARDAYIAAAKAGNPEAGDRLRNLGDDSDAEQAYVAAASVGGMYVSN
ncbi:MAG: hypothetical protein ACYCW6_09070 [Candidatus Xenobia bacterium]